MEYNTDQTNGHYLKKEVLQKKKNHPQKNNFIRTLKIVMFGEMVNFGESDKMIKISGEMDKSDVY